MNGTQVINDSSYENAHKVIIRFLNNMNECLCTLKNQYGYDTGELYHTIPITEKPLFKVAGDHLRIRSFFLPFLKFFDLSYISFDNVDIRYVSFINTHADFNLRSVYKMDASFAEFGDENTAFEEHPKSKLHN